MSHPKKKRPTDQQKIEGVLDQLEKNLHPRDEEGYFQLQRTRESLSSYLKNPGSPKETQKIIDSLTQAPDADQKSAKKVKHAHQGTLIPAAKINAIKTLAVLLYDSIKLDSTPDHVRRKLLPDATAVVTALDLAIRPESSRQQQNQIQKSMEALALMRTHSTTLNFDGCMNQINALESAMKELVQ